MYAHAAASPANFVVGHEPYNVSSVLAHEALQRKIHVRTKIATSIQPRNSYPLLYRFDRVSKTESDASLIGLMAKVIVR